MIRGDTIIYSGFESRGSNQSGVFESQANGDPRLAAFLGPCESKGLRNAGALSRQCVKIALNDNGPAKRAKQIGGPTPGFAQENREWAAARIEKDG